MSDPEILFFYLQEHQILIFSFSNRPDINESNSFDYYRCIIRRKVYIFMTPKYACVTIE